MITFICLLWIGAQFDFHKRRKLTGDSAKLGNVCRKRNVVEKGCDFHITVRRIARVSKLISQQIKNGGVGKKVERHITYHYRNRYGTCYL